MEETMIAEKKASELQPSDPQAAPEAAESYETIDYVKELFLNSIEQRKADKTKIRLMRFCAVCMALVVVLLAAALILAGPYVNRIVNDIDQLTQKVLAIDIKAITTDLATLMKNANVALDSVSSAANNIAEIDMESLNGAIDELTKAVENFSKLDIAKLNSAIENFYAAAEEIGKIKIPAILGG